MPTGELESTMSRSNHSKDYEDPRFLMIMCSLLKDLVSENDERMRQQLIRPIASISDAINEVDMRIYNYMQKFFWYGDCSLSCFLLGYIYLQNFNQQTPITSVTVHLIFAKSGVCAIKFLEDIYVCISILSNLKKYLSIMFDASVTNGDVLLQTSWQCLLCPHEWCHTDRDESNGVGVLVRFRHPSPCHHCHL